MRIYVICFVMGLMSMGCAESIKHDEVLAGKRATEFARRAFVKRDIENGYALLSESIRRYVPLTQFKEVVSKLHPSAFPATVRATEYEAVSGEKIIHIYLLGENSSARFYYRLTMEGSAATDYKVLRLYRSSEPYPPSSNKQIFRQAPNF